jgi:hypothetical protein
VPVRALEGLGMRNKSNLEDAMLGVLRNEIAVLKRHIQHFGLQVDVLRTLLGDSGDSKPEETVATSNEC